MAPSGGSGSWGDVAIYVSPGGADHRAYPELFQLGPVAGAPPDAHSEPGQLWGNPLYDWPTLRRRGHGWWIERALFSALERSLGLACRWSPKILAHRVVYPGTHDQDTARGWLESLLADWQAFVHSELARLGFREPLSSGAAPAIVRSA